MASPSDTAGVLVVEDSSVVATVVRYYLELEGFEVLHAADGAQGLAMARRERPDLVVTDLSMPGMDGLAVKPVEPRRLAAHARALLERRQQPAPAATR